MFRSPVSRRGLAGLLGFALLCWACTILWLSSLTPQQLPGAAFLFWDKFNHFSAFVLGGWLAASTLRVSRPLNGTVLTIVLAVLLVAAFGGLDESLQSFTPGRTGGDIYDWLADLLGAVTGALLSLPTHGRLERLLPHR